MLQRDSTRKQASCQYMIQSLLRPEDCRPLGPLVVHRPGLLVLWPPGTLFFFRFFLTCLLLCFTICFIYSLCLLLMLLLVSLVLFVLFLCCFSFHEFQAVLLTIRKRVTPMDGLAPMATLFQFRSDPRPV